MSLKNQFKIDTAAARDGMWVEYQKNADGTVPGFKLARMSPHDRRYSAALRKNTERYSDPLTGKLDMNTSDEDAEKIALDTFLDAVLLDWRNIQPNDDGIVLEFNRDNAAKLLSDEAWSELYADLRHRASNAANYRAKAAEAQAKN